MEPGAHAELLRQAMAVEARAQRSLLAGERGAAAACFREAADLYRRSWEAAPPRSFGRLVGMLKASVLAGDARGAASYVRAAAPSSPDSPTLGYLSALAALVEGDDAAARRGVEAMASGDEPFLRAAAVIRALLEGDADRYASALRDVVHDFESRSAHLTGVAIADTAAMFEVLARERGLAADLTSAVLPPSGTTI